MKQVLFKQDLPVQTIELDQLRPDRVYLAPRIMSHKPTGEVFILRYEPENPNFPHNGGGWILRFWNASSGCSGFYETAKETLQAARGMEFIKEVYEFDTFQEASEWAVIQSRK